MGMRPCLLWATVSAICYFHLVNASPTTADNTGLSLLGFRSNELCPALECGSKNITITFQKDQLTNVQVDLTNIHLIDSTCKGVSKDSSIYVWSPTKVGKCGTTVNVNKTHANYENIIYLKPDPSLVIYREEYRVNVSCIYPLTMNVSLGTVLHPIMSQKIIKIVGNGEFKVSMAVYTDPAYTIPREVGDSLSTSDKLYVGVMIDEGDTDSFHMVLRNCFATPTENFYDPKKYYIIRNGCKNTYDKTIHVAANGITNYGQFSVQAFRFIGYTYITLHCQIHLCDRTKGSCIPDCSTTPPDFPADNETSIGLPQIPIKEPTAMCIGLQCGASHINVTFQKTDLEDALVDVPNVRLNEKNCHEVHDDNRSVSIGWPLGAGKCGTTLTTNSSHANYENSIYLPPSPSQIIYRADYYINISCVYPLDLNVSIENAIEPLISIKTFSITGFGNFEVKMAAFLDKGYKVPIKKGEAQISTKDRLFVGVFISKGDKEQFNLVMLQCYATPTNNPLDKVSYGIIVNSCPNPRDGTVEVYANGILHEGKFSFQMFKFIDYQYVFLHCKVRLCSKSTTCIPYCARSSFRNAETEGEVLTLGPFQRADSGEKTSESPAAKETTTAVATTTSSAGKRTHLDHLMLFAVLLITIAL